jgi:pimeloyl-ACP methyl ester carboxylesterase
MGKNKFREFSEEYVDINGISQYFLHYPSDNGAVMLVIHGGPGQSEAHFAYLLEEDSRALTTVYYDQRGTGKTLLKNPTKGDDVTFDKLFCDLEATVAFLKERYHKDKIILSGHSWGSLLGLTYAKKYPKNLACYIGCGQVVNMRRGEKLIFDRLYAMATDREDTKCKQILHSLGDYPNSVTNAEQLIKTMLTLMKVKSRLGVGFDMTKLRKLLTGSPIFKFSDLLAATKAQKLLGHLSESLLEFNAESMIDFEIPLCFVHGEKDWQVPIELAKEYYEKINAPSKGFYTVEGASHITFLENPQGAVAALAEAVSQHAEKE